MNREEHGRLMAFNLGTLALFYLIWACFHDIAHGDEGTAEWTVPALRAVVFLWMCRSASRHLAGPARVTWLLGTGALLLLFTMGAVASLLQPKYPKDPMLALTFLCAGGPGLLLIGYYLRRGASTERAG